MRPALAHAASRSSRSAAATPSGSKRPRSRRSGSSSGPSVRGSRSRSTRALSRSKASRTRGRSRASSSSAPAPSTARPLVPSSRASRCLLPRRTDGFVSRAASREFRPSVEIWEPTWCSASRVWPSSRISTGDGKILVRGIDGTVRAESGDGDIEVERASGELRLLTEDGSIVGTDLDARVDASTGDGSIELEGSFARLEASDLGRKHPHRLSRMERRDGILDRPNRRRRDSRPAARFGGRRDRRHRERRTHREPALLLFRPRPR